MPEKERYKPTTSNLHKRSAKSMHRSNGRFVKRKGYEDTENQDNSNVVAYK